MPLAAYTKPHLTVREQIALLKGRGMQISDVAKAEEYLQRIGYYRLSGYWYPFRESRVVTKDGKLSVDILDTFKSGSEFKHVVELYVFDKKLRLIVLDAIERIEIALRVDIAHLLGSYHPCAHREPALLHGKFSRPDKTGNIWHQRWLRDLSVREQRSREDFIKHYRQKYSSPMPIWMSIEVWDFGLMSTLFENLQIKDQLIIANKYGVSRPELMVSWIKSINHVRNICAHHSRLWNCSPVDQPKLPKTGEAPLLEHWTQDKFSQSRIYPILSIIQFLLLTINPTSLWKHRLKQHLESEFPQVSGISIQHAGFPDQWRAIPLWR